MLNSAIADIFITGYFTRNGRSTSSITISLIISLGEYNSRSGLDTERKKVLALS